jgi:putative PIN family toxin of toxin-antitoxin system
MRPSPRSGGRALRAVVDTNVLVSGLIAPAGAPGTIVRAIADGRIDLVLTAPLADELREVIVRPRLARYAIDERMLAAVLELVWPLLPEVDVQVALRDPADGIVVEAAVAGRAEMIVTGDRDLLDDLDLRAWLVERGIDLVAPTALARRLAPRKPAGP